MPVGSAVTVTLQVPGMDLSGARITWEARDQEPAFGGTFTFSPKNNGVQWVEAEAQWPGRPPGVREGELQRELTQHRMGRSLGPPPEPRPAPTGGDSWNWVNSNPNSILDVAGPSIRQTAPASTSTFSQVRLRR